MPILSILLGPEPHWPDLGQKLEQVIHLDASGPPIQIASLPGGMVSGKTSLCFRFDLPDGKVVLAETSLALFLTAARAFAAKYPLESEGMEPGSEIQRALQAAHGALRSYQHGNSSPDLAQEVADHLTYIITDMEKKDT